MLYKNKMKQNVLLLNKMIENLNQETESIKRTNENCEMENTISNIKMSLDRINRKIKMTSEINSKIEGTEKKNLF